MNNQRQIALAISIWSQDHDEMLPKAEKVWQDITLDADVLVCPEKRNLANGYCYSILLSGKPLGDFPDSSAATILVTCDGDNTDRSKLLNICYGVQDIAFRHKQQQAVCSFLDGHVEAVKTADPKWFTMPTKARKAGK